MSRPRAIVLAATLVLLAAACSSGNGHATATKPGRRASALAFETIVQLSVPGQVGGERREVVRDAAAWQVLWTELRQGSGLAAERPAVDFSREMVIAAAMDTQSCIARVTIRTVTRSAGGVVVDLLEAPPAPDCRCIVAERPIHVIRLARLSDPVRFTAERGVTSCG